MESNTQVRLIACLIAVVGCVFISVKQWNIQEHSTRFNELVASLSKSTKREVQHINLDHTVNTGKYQVQDPQVQDPRSHPIEGDPLRQKITTEEKNIDHQIIGKYEH